MTLLRSASCLLSIPNPFPNFSDRIILQDESVVKYDLAVCNNFGRIQVFT